MYALEVEDLKFKNAATWGESISFPGKDRPMRFLHVTGVVRAAEIYPRFLPTGPSSLVIISETDTAAFAHRHEAGS